MRRTVSQPGHGYLAGYSDCYSLSQDFVFYRFPRCWWRESFPMRIPSSSTNKWSDTEKCDRLSYKEAKEPCIGTETVIHSTGVFSSSTAIPRIPASSFQKE